ncbi:MAG: UDP-N-acetylglucosamine 2-epimerase [Acidobacteriota bacterium]
MSRKVAVATFARSDYGSCLPILRALRDDPDVELVVFAAGMHLVPEFGHTLRAIEADGFEITETIEMFLAADSRRATAKAIGLGTQGFADALARHRPQILLMIGDRCELLAAASAALVLQIPVAHVSGGEITEGAIDDQVRHALTKLSHLHFVSHEEHAARVLQMGEEPWRVRVTGDPALDLLHQEELLDRQALEKHLGIPLVAPVAAVTFHPTTLGITSAEDEVGCLLSALSDMKGTLILTAPNADPEYRSIYAAMERFVDQRSHAGLFANLGQRVYYSLLAEADLMVGNSSSGIWEAPSFKLPVVNLGDRQRGRLRAANVIDVEVDAEKLGEAIHRTLDPAFREQLAGLENPYGDGRAAAQIVAALKDADLGLALLRKKFIDQPCLAAPNPSDGDDAEETLRP